MLLLLLLLLAFCNMCRASKVTVDRYSEPHYFNGFQWQLVLQVTVLFYCDATLLSPCTQLHSC
jgi:hypothetical protein